MSTVQGRCDRMGSRLLHLQFGISFLCVCGEDGDEGCRKCVTDGGGLMAVVVMEEKVE